MASTLPWLDSLLESVKKELSTPLPKVILGAPSSENYTYVTSIALEQDPFDVNKLKSEMAQGILQKTATIYESTCTLGTILVVKLNSDTWNPPWKTWWRCIRLLSPKKHARIVIFAHPLLRELPQKGLSVGAGNVNGGYTTRCDATSVVIYRKEEATRVLIHELFHASCSDPYHKDTPHIEGDTEAWAELVQCALFAKGQKKRWNQVMKEQIHYALNQASILKNKFHIQSSTDYVWRYVFSRLDVWRSLGLDVPSIPKQYKLITSMRLTIHEPNLE